MPPRPSPPTRPATISELATLAQADPDASPSSNLELKHYLRRAEVHRREGKALASGAGGGPTASNPRGSSDAGTDMERAFIEYAQAATLIVEKIPGHRDYGRELTAEQKSNLTAVSTSAHCSSSSFVSDIG
ncbi:hypothetical protein DFH09DRAFT_922265 [Mycena vulgaris]|nr:hypothetical protein DFH09DRAFT_922265 [Mycena vulgaris]